MDLPVMLPDNFELGATEIKVDGKKTTVLDYFNQADFSPASMLSIISDLVIAGESTSPLEEKIKLISWGTCPVPP